MEKTTTALRCMGWGEVGSVAYLGFGGVRGSKQPNVTEMSPSQDAALKGLCGASNLTEIFAPTF